MTDETYALPPKQLSAGASRRFHDPGCCIPPEAAGIVTGSVKTGAATPLLPPPRAT